MHANPIRSALTSVRFTAANGQGVGVFDPKDDHASLVLRFSPESHMDTNNSAARTLFLLGQTLATRGALAELADDDILSALNRHSSGDWGDLDEEDVAANTAALKSGGRLLSTYHSATGEDST